jgi:hypothetical protein
LDLYALACLPACLSGLANNKYITTHSFPIFYFIVGVEVVIAMKKEEDDDDDDEKDGFVSICFKYFNYFLDFFLLTLD